MIIESQVKVIEKNLKKVTEENKDVKPNMAQPPATPVLTATTNWRASLTGSLEAYVLGENFDDYLDRVNNYFELNGIPDEIYKIRLLLHLIGPVASTKITVFNFFN